MTCKARRVKGSIMEPFGVSPCVLVGSMRWAWLQRGLLWLSAALSCQLRACACWLLLGAARGRLRADGEVSWGMSWAVRHRMVPWQMSIAGISACEEWGLFTMCCGISGLALILVLFLWKSVSEQSRVSMWLLMEETKLPWVALMHGQGGGVSICMSRQWLAQE